MRWWSILLVVVPIVPALAAVPPSRVNYQGVLRDASDKPLTGSYDMTFRFMDAASGGNEILTDQHVASSGNAVPVSGGLFNVALGSGTVADGSGPGNYTSLDAVFRDYGSVWLEVVVAGETLSPRTQIQSTPYALNASQFAGQPPGNFIDTSSTQQTKSGRFNVFAYDAGGFALVGQATASGATGGYFNGGIWGVHALGGSASYGAAGYFEGQGISRGILVRSNDGAGRFEATNSYAPTADVANGNTGVAGQCLAYGGNGVWGTGERKGVYGQATGTAAGGAVGGDFSASGSSSVGVRGAAATGGSFSTTANPPVTVNLADGTIGVNETGGVYGGLFQTAVTGSTAVSAVGDAVGVGGSGNTYGGSFTGGSYGVYAYSSGGTGLKAFGGASAGVFDTGVGATATLARSDGFGIAASGPGAYGGYFSNGSPYFSYAYMPYSDLGLLAYGATAGAQLHNFSSSAYANVSYSTYKIWGNGAVSFVQNHPSDPSKVIVYAAPEGDEVAVYTRGSARLVDGEARVPLGETFALVANPDLGLTANVTPIGAPVALSVVSKSTSELVVRGPAGSKAEFDFIVWGLRIGFEETSVVQPKQRDAKIPSMYQHEQFFAADAALRNYTALARYQKTESGLHGRAKSDLSRAAQLRDAVGVYAFQPPGPAAQPVAGDPARLDVTPAPAAPGPQSAPGGAAIVRAGVEPAVAGLPVATAPPPLRFEVTEPVEAGDLLTLDPLAAGKLRRCASPSDPNVAGIAEQPSTEVDGLLKVAVATTTYALVKVDAQYGAIQPGDLLVSSATPGHAMISRKPLPGTVIGKALEPLETGTGAVRVLLLAR